MAQEIFERYINILKYAIDIKQEYEWLKSQIQAYQAKTKNKVPSVYLTPFFIPIVNVDYLEKVFNAISNAIEEVLNNIGTNISLDLPDAHWKKIAALKSASKRKMLLAEFITSYRVDGNFKIFNINFEKDFYFSYFDWILEKFENIYSINELKKYYRIYRDIFMPDFVNALLDNYTQIFNSYDYPDILIFSEDEAIFKADIYQEYLKDRGLNVEIASIGKLKYKSNKLLYNGKIYNLILLLLSSSVLLETLKNHSSLIEAIDEGSVLPVNHPSIFLYTSDFIFSLLYNPLFLKKMDSFTVKIIERHVPWTATFFEEITEYMGEKIKLKEFIIANKDEFILKPILNSPNCCIIAGENMTKQNFANFIKNNDMTQWVVQEHFDIYETEVIDIRENDFLRRFSYVVNFSVFSGKYAGAGGRLLKKDSGEVEGILPVFYYAKREHVMDEELAHF